MRDPSRRVRLLSSARSLSGASYVSVDDEKEYLLWMRNTALVAQNSEKLQLLGDSFSVADPAVTVSAGGKNIVYAPSRPSRQFNGSTALADRPASWANRVSTFLAVFRPTAAT